MSSEWGVTFKVTDEFIMSFIPAAWEHAGKSFSRDGGVMRLDSWWFMSSL